MQTADVNKSNVDILLNIWPFAVDCVFSQRLVSPLKKSKNIYSRGLIFGARLFHFPSLFIANCLYCVM